jgi:hypothetical protein
VINRRNKTRIQEDEEAEIKKERRKKAKRERERIEKKTWRRMLN